MFKNKKPLSVYDFFNEFISKVEGRENRWFTYSCKFMKTKDGYIILDEEGEISIYEGA
jgi:hypothetical protein